MLSRTAPSLVIVARRTTRSASHGDWMCHEDEGVVITYLIRARRLSDLGDVINYLWQNMDDDENDATRESRDRLVFSKH